MPGIKSAQDDKFHAAERVGQRDQAGQEKRYEKMSRQGEIQAARQINCKRKDEAARKPTERRENGDIAGKAKCSQVGLFQVAVGQSLGFRQ